MHYIRHFSELGIKGVALVDGIAIPQRGTLFDDGQKSAEGDKIGQIFNLHSLLGKN